MIIELDKYEDATYSTHRHILVKCDSGKNAKCLGTFSREKRIIATQRKRIGDRDFCKFCQKTEEFTGRGNPNTKYFFDDDILNNIDTPEKAYLLGWIASDGSISKDSITISIRDYDIETLMALRCIVDPGIPVTEHANTSMLSITFNSTIVANACIKHLKLKGPGKKDASVEFPDIEKYLEIYFIRGFFEGDGSVSLANRIPRVSIASNSENMLNSIKNKMGCGKVYGTSWQTTNGNEALEFLSKIYSDLSIPYLHRKYLHYEKISAWVPSKAGTGTSIKFNTTQGFIKFNKTRHDAVLPKITDIHASGIDLHILEKIKDFSDDVSLYTTGIKVQPPEGYYFILVGRSSISKSGYSLANGIGIIDENYIGEILVPLRKHESTANLELPNRLVQLVLLPKINCEFVVVDSLEDTERGTGGFGSTGK